MDATLEELDSDLYEEGDECAEGGQHHAKRRHFDADEGGGWAEMCTECGELLDTSDGSHLA